MPGIIGTLRIRLKATIERASNMLYQEVPGSRRDQIKIAALRICPTLEHANLVLPQLLHYVAVRCFIDGRNDDDAKLVRLALKELEETGFLSDDGPIIEPEKPPVQGCINCSMLLGGSAAKGPDGWLCSDSCADSWADRKEEVRKAKGSGRRIGLAEAYTAASNAQYQTVDDGILNGIGLAMKAIMDIPR